METFPIIGFGGLNQVLLEDGDAHYTTDLDGVEMMRGRVVGCRGIVLIAALPEEAEGEGD